MTMRLSRTVTEIWRLRDNGVTSLIFWGSRDVIGGTNLEVKVQIICQRSEPIFFGTVVYGELLH